MNIDSNAVYGKYFLSSLFFTHNELRPSSFKFNTLVSSQNGRHFANDTSKCIFLDEVEFVPKRPISYIQALDQIMAWRRPGDKPISKLTMVKLLKHIYVTRLHWINKAVIVMEFTLYLQHKWLRSDDTLLHRKISSLSTWFPRLSIILRTRVHHHTHVHLIHLKAFFQYI